MSRIALPNLRIGGLRQFSFGDPVYDRANLYPNLDLDFATNKNLTDNKSGKTSLVSFSRSAASSPGTYVDSQGLVKKAAVNLALYSEQFDNAAWLKNNSTVLANQSIAPDGKQTADELKATGTIEAAVYRIISTTGITTSSVFVKKNTARYFIINTINTGRAVWFDLDTGSIANQDSETEGTIVDVGNGWYRCSVSTNNANRQTFYVANSDSSFAATVGQSVFVWGGQFEETDPALMGPSAYIKTTSQTLCAPRFDHQPTSGNITTNLFKYSEMLDNTSAWTAFNATVTANATTDPDGGQAADRLTLTNGSVRQNVAGNLSGQTYTVSFYAKTVSGTANVPIHFTEASTPYSLLGSQTANITNSWQKFTVTATLSATSQTSMNVWFGSSGATTTADFYVYQAQLEKSSSAGTYVRTLGETRSISDATAESLGLLVEEQRQNLLQRSQELNISPWLNNVGGTIITANQGVAPDGTATADLAEDNPGSANAPLVVQSVSVTGGQTITLSFYLKKFGTATSVNLRISDNLGGGVSTPVTLTDEWQRFSTSHVITAGATSASIGLANVPLGGILAWGAQAEVGTFPTSYIPTVSSQTRYADVAAIQDEDFNVTNLLSYSESFDVGWTLTGFDSFGAGSVANAITSPDGQTTADFLRPSTATGFKGIEQTTSFPATATKIVYVKDSGVRYVQLVYQSTRSINYANYDLQNIEVTQTGGPAVVGASISDAGDGWRRLVITETGTVTTASHFITPIPSPTSVRAASYTGDGTSGIYLWGASLTATSYPVDYVSTRNLLRDSQDFERSSWTEVGSQINNNIYIAPDGTLTADEMQGTASTTSLGIYGTSATVVSGVTYNISAYFKYVNHQWIWIRGDRPSTAWVAFDIQNGIVGNEYDPLSVISSPSIEDIGNGWYRVSFNITTTSAGVFNTVFTFGTGNTPTNGAVSLIGTEKMAAWGAQLEPGSTATEYYRTYDVVGKNYNWYEPTEGTLYAVSTRYSNNDAFQRVVMIASALPSVSEQFSILKYNTQEAGYLASPGLQVNKPLVSAGTEMKAAFAAQLGNHAFTINGDTPATNSTLQGLGDGMVQMLIGQTTGPGQIQNGHIKRIIYFPRRIKDSNLVLMTE